MDNQIKSLTSAISTLIALQLVSLLVMVGGGFYVLGDMKQYVMTNASNSSRPTPPKNVDNWQALLRDHNAVQGGAEAGVVVIEFSDFQCPYCKQFTEGTRHEIVQRFGSNVRMVFKHLPLQPIHPQAMTAAIAAQCAQREGKFWEIHDRFFGQPDALNVASVISVGETLGLGSSYANCVTNEETRREVEQDIEDATDAGIQGTPTFVVNGKVLVGAQSTAAFASAFKQAGLAAN